jgi:hypothetical protein
MHYYVSIDPLNVPLQATSPFIDGPNELQRYCAWLLRACALGGRPRNRDVASQRILLSYAGVVASSAGPSPSH